MSSLGFEILGAVKVCDGIFVGDEHAAQDLEFVVSNKVTHIVNASGRQIANHWEAIGVVYLTYHWVDNDSQIILDNRDVVANEFFSFIEDAVANYESVLIHSVRGQSRSCCVLVAYLIRKFRWGLRKTLEFVSSRRPDINLKPAFMSQLSGYERRLATHSTIPFSLDWSDNSGGNLECEELVLRNTFINSQVNPIVELKTPHGPRVRRLVWADNEDNDRARLETPAHVGRLVVRLGHDGRPITKPIIRVQKPAVDSRALSVDRKAPADSHGVASRPTTAGSAEPASLGDTEGSHENESSGLYDRSESVGRNREGARGQNRHTSIGGRGDSSHSSNQNGECGAPFRRDASHRKAWGTTLGAQGLSSRSASAGRDPSPRTSDRVSSRDPSPQLSRGESPIRLHKANRPQTQAGPLGGFGLGQRALTRPAPTLGGSLGRNPPAGNPSSWWCLRRLSAGGMSAFRSGGPVKARADAIGVENQASFTASLQQSFRQTQQAAPRRGSGSRPASPVGVKQPGSRQSSVQSRPPSPGKGPVKPVAVKQRHMSQHMRRAASPTPMCMRDASKPRWRT